MIAGSALGVATGNPIGAFLVGTASHIVLDQIPHTDPGIFLKNNELKVWPKWIYYFAYLDILAGVTVVLILASQTNSSNWLNLFAGAFGGIFLDLLDNVPYWSKKFRKTIIGQSIHAFHDKFHFTVDSQHLIWGILTQIIVVIGGLWYLLQNL